MEWSEDSKMAEAETSPAMAWKLYDNPLYSPPSDLSNLTVEGRAELEEARAEIAELRAELELERGLRVKMESISEEQVSRMRREIEEEKKMMRVAEVFREGKEKPYINLAQRGFVSPVSVLRRSPSPEPQNPHIRRGIRGSVEFQRALKAMCTLNKNLASQNGNYKLESQKAQLKILLKQRIPLRPNNSYFIT